MSAQRVSFCVLPPRLRRIAAQRVRLVRRTRKTRCGCWPWTLQPFTLKLEA